MLILRRIDSICCYVFPRYKTTCLSLGYVIYVHVHIYSIETFIHMIHGICMNIYIGLQFSVLTETPRDNHFHYISKHVIFYEKKDTINYRHSFRFDTFYING